MWYCKNVTKRISVKQQQEQPRRHHYSSKIHTVPIYLEEINGGETSALFQDYLNLI
jgi:hypothetical protein